LGKIVGRQLLVVSLQSGLRARKQPDTIQGLMVFATAERSEESSLNATGRFFATLSSDVSKRCETENGFLISNP
jgi:hypothetical protein